jgi:hypothetical protein
MGNRLLGEIREKQNVMMLILLLLDLTESWLRPLGWTGMMECVSHLAMQNSDHCL